MEPHHFSDLIPWKIQHVKKTKQIKIIQEMWETQIMQVTIAHKQNGIFNICVNFGGSFSLKHVLHLKNPRPAKLQGCTSPTLFLKMDVSKLQSTMRPLLAADFFPVYLCQKSKATEKLQNVTARPMRNQLPPHISK